MVSKQHAHCTHSTYIIRGSAVPFMWWKNANLKSALPPCVSLGDEGLHVTGEGAAFGTLCVGRDASYELRSISNESLHFTHCSVAQTGVRMQ